MLNDTEMTCLCQVWQNYYFVWRIQSPPTLCILFALMNQEHVIGQEDKHQHDSSAIPLAPTHSQSICLAEVLFFLLMQSPGLGWQGVAVLDTTSDLLVGWERIRTDFTWAGSHVFAWLPLAFLLVRAVVIHLAEHSASGPFTTHRADWQMRRWTQTTDLPPSQQLP